MKARNAKMLFPLLLLHQLPQHPLSLVPIAMRRERIIALWKIGFLYADAMQVPAMDPRGSHAKCAVIA